MTDRHSGLRASTDGRSFNKDTRSPLSIIERVLTMSERPNHLPNDQPPHPAPAEQTSSPSATTPPAPPRSGNGPVRMSAASLPWNARLSNMIDRQVGKLRGWREEFVARKETSTVKEFKEILELAKDTGTIELALVRVAAQLTGAALVELLLDTGQGNAKPTTIRIAGWPAKALVWSLAEVDALGYPLSLGLWCGEERRLALQVFEEPSERRKGRLTPRLIRRLTELCALAAAAERELLAQAQGQIEAEAKARAANAESQRRSSKREPSEFFIPFPELKRPAGPGMVHDATFLNAVLPFAIAQASRHQEPLTVLSIETVSLPTLSTGERSEKSFRSNKEAAEAIARSLRASDVVVLLDDNRIIVVLPDTSPTQAKPVIEITRNAIIKVNPQSPNIAVSPFRLGMASFPTDAHDMTSLLIAADNAAEPSLPTPFRGHGNRAHKPHVGAAPHSLSIRSAD